LLPFTVALGVTAMPQRQLKVNFAISGFFFVLTGLGGAWRAIQRHMAAIIVLLFISGVVAGVVSISFNGGMWLPMERLTVASGSVVTG